LRDPTARCRRADHEFASNDVVSHKQDEYVRGNTYTNTAEGYFSQLKRSIDGTHHHVSPRHLPRYLSEFDYRYNTRKETDSDWTKKAIRGGRGKRLMYEKANHRD
jgi:hypothetical protein